VSDAAPDVHVLSGAYAVGAVDAAEAAAFERHLADCAECRDEVRSFREVLVQLAEASAEPPPPDLRARVLARVRVSGPNPVAGAGPVAPAPQRRPARVPWAIAAVLAAVTAVTGSVALSEHRSASQARRLASVLVDPAAVRVDRPATGGGSVQLVVSGDRAAVVTTGMPGLAEGVAYQLWVVRPDGVSSAGVGPAGSRAAGHWTRLVGRVREGETVAISVEPSGGSEQPTTVPIVALKA
jgi:anti-sigma-K factor RskA